MTTKRPRRRPDPLGGMTPEERYLVFGGERPEGFGLHQARSKEGADARAAVDYLLAQLRGNGAFVGAARRILHSCALPGEQPLDWSDLMALDNAYWKATVPLLHYVRRTGGLRCMDFEDNGREFNHWVFDRSADNLADHSQPDAVAHAQRCLD